MITVTAAEWPALGLSTVGQEWGWGLWDPPLPGELLAIDRCWVWVWGADVLSYVATGKPTRLQWMVLQFWTHRRLWLDSVGHTTIHKDMNWVSRKGFVGKEVVHGGREQIRGDTCMKLTKDRFSQK